MLSPQFFLKYSPSITRIVSGIVGKYRSFRSFSRTLSISSGNANIIFFIAILYTNISLWIDTNIYDSISTYIDGYTTMMMATNMGTSVISDALDGRFFVAFPIGYFLTIGFTRRGEIELEYYFLTRNSRTIQSSSNVVLM
jgi:hypothetical protein